MQRTGLRVVCDEARTFTRPTDDFSHCGPARELRAERAWRRLYSIGVTVREGGSQDNFRWACVADMDRGAILFRIDRSPADRNIESANVVESPRSRLSIVGVV
jgi:hypothetical protein